MVQGSMGCCKTESVSCTKPQPTDVGCLAGDTELHGKCPDAVDLSKRTNGTQRTRGADHLQNPGPGSIPTNLPSTSNLLPFLPAGFHALKWLCVPLFQPAKPTPFSTPPPSLTSLD